jgi:hypothetical protein
VAEEKDAIGRDAQRVGEISPGRVGVAIQARFARCAAALAVAPVVERQQAESERAQVRVVERTPGLGKVPAVAVADEEPAARDARRPWS